MPVLDAHPSDLVNSYLNLSTLNTSLNNNPVYKSICKK